MSHIPVLLYEVIASINPQPGDFIIDGTVGDGGHAREIFKRLNPKGTLLGIDWDGSSFDVARKNILSDNEKTDSSLVLEKGNYADLPDILEKKNLGKADGLLIDLGFSSRQLESSGLPGQGRGFSFNLAEGKDEPLIMTYDDERTPVAALLRSLKEHELAEIIRDYGEERYARPIAKAIKERGHKSAIVTSRQLAETIRGAVSSGYERGRIHPATRTFQALRIYANDELGNLERLLKSIPEIVKPGGRVAIISFHSLEDRMVKRAFREAAAMEMMEILTKKPVEAKEEEVAQNPRSRSAKLRSAILL